MNTETLSRPKTADEMEALFDDMGGCCFIRAHYYTCHCADRAPKLRGIRESSKNPPKVPVFFALPASSEPTPKSLWLKKLRSSAEF